MCWHRSAGTSTRSCSGSRCSPRSSTDAAHLYFRDLAMAASFRDLDGELTMVACAKGGGGKEREDGEVPGLLGFLAPLASSTQRLLALRSASTSLSRSKSSPA